MTISPEASKAGSSLNPAPGSSRAQLDDSAVLVLHLDHVSRWYPSGTSRLLVLDDVGFSVAAGSTLSIVGPSGSGKTTLLGLCAGLDRADSGAVELCGQRLEALSEDERARLRNERVGFVFQSFHLLPTLTALENVMVPLELLRARGAAATATALLNRLGLAERLHHYPAQLSGGEQQRVALARAFVHRPKILFADEPTGNLDLENRERIVEELFLLNRDFATTLVLVTHDLELAARAQRTVHLRGGRVVEDVRQDVHDRVAHARSRAPESPAGEPR